MTLTHITPPGDVYDHTREWVCQCRPEREPTREGWVIRHQLLARVES